MADVREKFQNWITQFSELEKFWNSIPEPAKTLFQIQINNFANEKSELFDEKYCAAIDRNDLLEKYVEELAEVILCYPSLPEESLLLAKEYQSRLVRCGANCT